MTPVAPDERQRYAATIQALVDRVTTLPAAKALALVQNVMVYGIVERVDPATADVPAVITAAQTCDINGEHFRDNFDRAAAKPDQLALAWRFVRSTAFMAILDARPSHQKDSV